MNCFIRRVFSSEQRPAAGIRLCRVLAHEGVASRRQAGELIKAGKVMVNGRKVVEPGFLAPMSARIDVVAGTPSHFSVKPLDNYDIPATNATNNSNSLIPRVWLHFKRRGWLVTEVDVDNRQRPCLLPELRRALGLGHLMPVGRLDFNSEGLLVLTNNGRYAQALEAAGVERVYTVRVRGFLRDYQRRQMARGVTVDGVRYAPIEVADDDSHGPRSGANFWLKMTLREGKNRQIRKVLAHYNLSITRLIRIKHGPYTLSSNIHHGDLQEVKYRALIDEEEAHKSTLRKSNTTPKHFSPLPSSMKRHTM